MGNNIPSFLLERPVHDKPLPMAGAVKTAFVDRGLRHAAGVINTGYAQWELASKDGFFQKLDARIKILFLLFFIVIVSVKKEIYAEAAIGCFIFALTAIAKINIFTFYRRVLFLGFVFGFLVALPSAFNVITAGEVILPVMRLSKSYDFWLYHIPETIGITRQGVSVVAMLTLRVVNSVSLSLLILSTTQFPEIIKALKVFKVPDVFLMMITLSYKYIFIFARTVEDMYLAKKSRMVSSEPGNEARQWVAGRVAFIFRKTRQRCDDIFKAMLARGFSDSIRLSAFKKPAASDWIAGFFLFSAGILFLWI